MVESSNVFAAAGPLACAERKAKGAGKYAGDALRAFGRFERAANAAVLVAQLSKAQSKLTKTFSKAEASGGCATEGDVGTIEAKAFAFINEARGYLAPLCGDGVLAPGEACDDGNTQDGDCCSSVCTLEAVCGDGVANVACGETCDPPDDSACSGLCQPDCTCPEPVCGNAVVETGEECEPGFPLPPSANYCGASATCGSASDPNYACRCCVPEGNTAFIDFGFSGQCCDGVPCIGGPHACICGCLELGWTCIDQTECCSLKCDLSGPAGVCTDTCPDAGASCDPVNPFTCCSGRCDWLTSTCLASCGPPGWLGCYLDTQCCSESCVSGICQ